MNLIDRDKNIIWHPYTNLGLNPESIPIVSAKGGYLFTEDGRTLIDAISSWWVNIHGHGNKEIADAIHAQLINLDQIIFAGFTHETGIKFAELLLTQLPKNQVKVFYSDNGSTSVEVALKMALQYHLNCGKKRNKIVAFEGAYHGDTFGAMALSARGLFNSAFQGFMFEVERLPVPNENNIEEVITKLNEIIKGGDLAAFIFEPLILGAGGMIMYSTHHLELLMNLCQANGVICIADEVMTGFYRTGDFLAASKLKVYPDIITLSKGITGGVMPLGVTTCTKEIFSAFDSKEVLATLYHGHSYTGNPLACAAAIKSLEMLVSLDTKQNIKMICNQNQEWLNRMKKLPKIFNPRVLGTIFAFEVGEPLPEYTNNLRDKIYQHALNNGVLLRPLGNTVYCMPPYCLTSADMDRIFECMIDIAKEISGSK